jgi:hypothetical protein
MREGRAPAEAGFPAREDGETEAGEGRRREREKAREARTAREKVGCRDAKGVLRSRMSPRMATSDNQIRRNTKPRNRMVAWAAGGKQFNRWRSVRISASN